MYYVLCAATIERYGRQGLNIYIYIRYNLRFINLV